MRVLLLLSIITCALIAGCGGGPAGLGTNTVDEMGGFGGSPYTSANKTANSLASSFWELEKLRAEPKVEVAKESTEKSANGEVALQELYYDCPGPEGKTLRIFAYCGAPTAKRGSKLPAIIIVHGGTGLSDKAQTIQWASRGYVALSMDLPGKGHGRDNSRSEGPAMDDEVIFTVKPSPKNSYIYSAVNSVCRAVSLLGKRPDVDANRIGIIGSSWGGTITLLVNGIDSRVAAACTEFGAGYITEESCWLANGNLKPLGKSGLRVWKQHFDPSSYLSSMHGRMLFVGATQDAYYPLKSFIRTYSGADCPKTLCLVANKNHAIDESASDTISRWFDWALRSGPELPSVKLAKDGKNFKITAKGEKPVTAVSLMTADGTVFQKATWKGSELKGGDGSWTMDPPAANVPYFITARDDGGALVAAEVHLAAQKK